MSRNREEAQRWFSQAQYDLQAAHVNERNGIYAWACFLCQQSAEKALTAFLYAHGEGPVIGHSSFRLAQECATFDPEFTSVERACKKLDGYYIPTRYPNGLPGGVPHEIYDAGDAAEALEAATSDLKIAARAGLRPSPLLSSTVVRSSAWMSVLSLITSKNPPVDKTPKADSSKESGLGSVS